jgi:DNA-binding XRE family transcriptional regulator
MTPADLKNWRTETMHWTQKQAAEALGVRQNTYQSWERGESFTTGRAIEIDQRTALACAALAHGIQPL